MWYVEYLRARKVLTIYCIVLVIAFVVAAALRRFVPAGQTGEQIVSVPMELFSSAAALIAAIFATFLSTSLGHQVAAHLEVAWTKPLSRERLILAILGVDAIAIAIGYAATIVVILGIITMYAQPGSIWYTATGFGRTAIMLFSVFALYMVIQAITSGSRRFAGTVAGISWPVMLILANAPAMGMPTPITRALELIDYVNPMMLLAPHGTTIDTREATAAYHVFSTGSEIDAFALIALGLVVCLLRWRRLEA